MTEATTPGGQSSPLDAERERLRKQGYTEAQISQILINQASGVGSQQTTGAAPSHSPMTGVASNLAAGATYAKNFIPGMAADLGTIHDKGTPAGARSQATVSLAVKIVVVVVIGYVCLLELIQLQSATTEAVVRAKAAMAPAASIKTLHAPSAESSLLESMKEIRAKTERIDAECVAKATGKSLFEVILPEGKAKFSALFDKCDEERRRALRANRTP